jgi:dTMP kinase
MEHLAREVEPALSAGKIVVSERYYHSTIAYQSAQGVDRNWLLELNRFARKPDLAFFIDVDHALGASRTKTGEIFENERFLSKVRKNYLMFEDMVRVDGSAGVDKVFEGVKKGFLDYSRHRH